MSNDKLHLADFLPRPSNVIRNGESIVEFHQGHEKVGELNFTLIFESIFDRIFNARQGAPNEHGEV
jgi:hypothetical protein